MCEACGKKCNGVCGVELTVFTNPNGVCGVELTVFTSPDGVCGVELTDFDNPSDVRDAAKPPAATACLGTGRVMLPV